MACSLDSNEDVYFFPGSGRRRLHGEQVEFLAHDASDRIDHGLFEIEQLQAVQSFGQTLRQPGQVPLSNLGVALTFTFEIPSETARLTSSSGRPDAPCSDSGTSTSSQIRPSRAQ
jgi:hypothetical protein